MDPFGLFSVSSWLKEKDRQFKDAWNTHVAEPFQEHIVEPTSKALNTYVAEPVKEYVVEPTKENIIKPAKKYLNDKVVQPALNWTIANAPDPVANFAKDIKNYDKNNSNEGTVLESHYFSSYNGKFVLNLPIGNNAFSFGFIGLGNNIESAETVKHEYGHTVQLEQRGIVDYTKNVAIPSVTANILNKINKLTYDYYGSSWEAEADSLGKVSRTTSNTPWPDGAYNSYWDLIKMFFN